MPRSKSASLSKLPRVPEVWLVGVAQLSVWITPEDETPYQPWLIIVVSDQGGAIRGTNILPTEPTPAQVRDVLYQAMREPLPDAGKPARPQGIAVADTVDVEGLVSLLMAAELELDIYEIEMPPEIFEMVEQLEEHLRGGPEHPGYLSVKGVTPELVGGFFHAAAVFYRAAPWVQLNNSQVLAVRHPAESDYRFAIVMGNGGVEYGVMMFREWEDVKRQFLGDDDPMEQIPDIGLQSVFFDSIARMPAPDLEAVEQFDWEVTAPNAYPIAWIVDRSGIPRRPSREDLEWYEAALLAIPLFVRGELKPNPEWQAGRITSTAEYAPVEAAMQVTTHSGEISVVVKYPAGEIPLAERSVSEPYRGAESEEDDNFLFFDRRALEGDMSRLTTQGRGEMQAGEAELAAAQEMMYHAWEESNPAKRITLAHDALEISEDCADAYVLLAEEEADTVSRALEYYRAGVAAGERALGSEYFQEYAGHFWGLLETRPYMRAREGLAKMLWRLNRKQEALAEYQEMLRLNPNDNQGIRYLMVELLLEMEEYDQLRELLKRYRNDWSAVWTYTQALLAFRRYGAKATAARALAKAFEQNPHVPPYLTGKKRIPNQLPNYLGMGDDREAIWYASDHLNFWRRTPGAVEWLTKELAAADQSNKGAKQKGGRRKSGRK